MVDQKDSVFLITRDCDDPAALLFQLRPLTQWRKLPKDIA